MRSNLVGLHLRFFDCLGVFTMVLFVLGRHLCAPQARPSAFLSILIGAGVGHLPSNFTSNAFGSISRRSAISPSAKELIETSWWPSVIDILYSSAGPLE